MPCSNSLCYIHVAVSQFHVHEDLQRSCKQERESKKVRKLGSQKERGKQRKAEGKRGRERQVICIRERDRERDSDGEREGSLSLSHLISAVLSLSVRRERARGRRSVPVHI